jgi:hypothetical protein
MGTPEPARFLISRSFMARVARGRRCRFEVRRLAVIHLRLIAGNEIKADLDSSLFSRRLTVVHLITAGATEQTRNRVSRCRSIAVVRSARAR